MLHGRIDKLFELGESDNFIKFAPDLALPHAKDCTAEEGVLAAGQFRVESGADFEQATNASMNLRPPGGRFCNARKDFQKGSLARTVAADEA